MPKLEPKHSNELWDRMMSASSTPGEELTVCPQCKSTWFETVHVQKFPKYYTSALGGAPPAKPNSYYFLRCVACNGLLEPEVRVSNFDQSRKDYEELIKYLSVEHDPKAEKI